MNEKPDRQLPVGAEALASKGVHFRVWAPKARHVEVVLEGLEDMRGIVLESEDNGYHSGLLVSLAAGDLYRFRLDHVPEPLPDPASRFQPSGPFGPSQVISAEEYHWRDAAWPGVQPQGQVLYEMHIGTFTPEGTWSAAARQLKELASLGITVVEIMPVADFPGKFGWGYDGVNLFAPTHLYGTPDDFRHFVDEAHAASLGVILDVVYNHVGPDGNFLERFSADYFTDRYKNDWGRAINFDGPHSQPVREFFIANAVYWIKEFHLDGLRLDATQQIFDGSSEHILAAMTSAVRAAAADRSVFIVAENEAQHTRLTRPVEVGGFDVDALWNDDFHRSALVALTGKSSAYYSDYRGDPQEFISAAKWGFLFQGQRYAWQKQRRGTPALDLAPWRFVTFLQNHDQIANSGQGLRCHMLTSPGRYRAMTALLLLGPGTPMLFQGQEFASSSPFLFFADHRAELARLVAQGRCDFLAQYPALALPETKAWLADPAAPLTFERCRLDFQERERHAEIYDLHRDLLKLRREDPVLRAPMPRGVDGAVLASQAFLLRFFANDGADRLLLMNLGRDLILDPAPEPLLAPPLGQRWKVQLSTEDRRYGGCGTPPLEGEYNWRIPGEAAVLLVPERCPSVSDLADFLNARRHGNISW